LARRDLVDVVTFVIGHGLAVVRGSAAIRTAGPGISGEGDHQNEALANDARSHCGDELGRVALHTG
jgi:hypothetical protein